MGALRSDTDHCVVFHQVAKWTGDFFNEGIYDIHIHLKGVPLLEWETEVEMDKYNVSAFILCCDWRNIVCRKGFETNVFGLSD